MAWAPLLLKWSLRIRLTPVRKMSDPARKPPAALATFDTEFEREESSVQSRQPPGRRARAQSYAQGETVAARTDRIDRKVRAAEVLLMRLPATSGVARLLASAILRRDEVLIDAVFAARNVEF
jgi:hypothetical protein